MSRVLPLLRLLRTGLWGNHIWRLGVNGLVFIGHGRSDANAIKNAIRVAKEAAEANVIESLKTAIEESLK